MQLNNQMLKTSQYIKVLINTNNILSKENTQLRLVAALLYNFAVTEINVDNCGCSLCAYCASPNENGNFMCSITPATTSDRDPVSNYCIPGILTKLMSPEFWDCNNFDKLAVSMKKVEDKLKMRLSNL